MYDTLTELQQQYLEGAFESEEEYQKAVEDAKKYYYDKLTQYSNLYQVAITTDSRVATDAWSSEFSAMIQGTENWKLSVEEYLGDVMDAFETWKV
jgi:hypothetical protein